MNAPWTPVAAAPHPASAPPATRDVAAGVWRLADPKISLASMASILLGAAAAWHHGALAPGWLLLTVLGIFAIEVAKNASGEVFDWHSGVDRAVQDHDRSPFSGGKRVLVDGLLTERDTWRVAAVGYLLGAGAGLAIVAWRAPGVLWIGVLGMALAMCYHAPPVQFAYRGLGELAVALAYGPLICTGTFLVQAGSVPPWVPALGIPLGLLVAAFLWVNEFPDYAADRGAGKRTLVVRLGRPRAARAYVALVATAYLLTLALPALVSGTPRGVWGGLVALGPSAWAARALLAAPERTAAIVPAQAATLLAFLVFALGAGLGLALT